MNAAASPGDELGMRCFLALLPEPASRRQLEQSRAALERASAGCTHAVRWIDPHSVHLTLRFFGHSSALQIDHFKQALPALAQPLPACATHRFGIWPNRARARLLVLELQTSAALSGLARECELHARQAGFAPEPRAFRAHLTLARLRPGCVFGVLPNPPPSIRFGALALMQSTLARPAAIHSELAHLALAHATA